MYKALAFLVLNVPLEPVYKQYSPVPDEELRNNIMFLSEIGVFESILELSPEIRYSWGWHDENGEKFCYYNNVNLECCCNICSEMKS